MLNFSELSPKFILTKFLQFLKVYINSSTSGVLKFERSKLISEVQSSKTLLNDLTSDVDNTGIFNDSKSVQPLNIFNIFWNFPSNFGKLSEVNFVHPSNMDSAVIIFFPWKFFKSTFLRFTQL